MPSSTFLSWRTAHSITCWAPAKLRRRIGRAMTVLIPANPAGAAFPGHTRRSGFRLALPFRVVPRRHAKGLAQPIDKVAAIFRWGVEKRRHAVGKSRSALAPVWRAGLPRIGRRCPARNNQRPRGGIKTRRAGSGSAPSRVRDGVSQGRVLHPLSPKTCILPPTPSSWRSADASSIRCRIVLSVSAVAGFRSRWACSCRTRVDRRE